MIDDLTALRFHARNSFTRFSGVDWFTRPDKFAAFMGFPPPVALHRAELECEEKTVDKLKALAGPHGYAFYKAMLAQNSDHF